MPVFKGLRAAAVAAACLVSAGSAQAAAVLTDATVFSTNAEGNNWLGLFWNTQGQPFDVPNRYNLYVTDTPAPGTPAFLNRHNDANTQIAIDLTPGDYTFRLFAESVSMVLPAELHFVLNLYLNGNQAGPDISGLYGDSCGNVCAAGHPNGLDILGASGSPEAATLTATAGGLQITLTAFDWDTSGTSDVVWPYWGNEAPYDQGSGQPDYIGQFTLRVTAVPEPATLALFGLGLAGLAVARRRA